MEIKLKDEKIHIGLDSWNKFDMYKAKDNKVLAIIDERVYQLYEKKIRRLLNGIDNKILLLKSPEDEKGMDVIFYLTQEAISFELTRYDLVMAIGGGATGDLAGFFASIYKRGVTFLNFPTTLIAQVDSAIGGKTAINHLGIKNVLGSFYPATETYIDPSLLTTLDKLDYVGGLGEVVKYGLIVPGFFTQIKEKLNKVLDKDLSHIEEIITKCVEIKVRVVEADYYETEGTRICLNLGHTLGHLIENKLPDRLNHGLSIIVGMDFAIYLALKLGYLSDEGFKERKKLLGLLLDYIPKFNLNNYHDELSKLKTDKKNRGKGIQFIIPTDNKFEIIELTSEELRQNIINYSGEFYD